MIETELAKIEGKKVKCSYEATNGGRGHLAHGEVTRTQKNTPIIELGSGKKVYCNEIRILELIES